MLRRPSARSGSEEGKLKHTLPQKEDGQVDYAATVAPLVVVPGDHLRQIAADYLGEVGIDDGAVGVAQHIGGDYGVFGVFQNALELAFGGRFQGRVDFLGGSVFR